MSDNEYINEGDENRAINRKEYKNEKVRELRERLGMDTAEFAAELGYSSCLIEFVERGLLPVNANLTRKICDRYHVSKKWLNGDDEEDTDSYEEDADVQIRIRLREIYEDSGLDQKEFAEITNTSTEMLRDVLEGKMQMTEEYAKKIEDAFHIGTDWILYGEKDAKNFPFYDSMIEKVRKMESLRYKICEIFEEAVRNV